MVLGNFGARQSEGCTARLLSLFPFVSVKIEGLENIWKSMSECRDIFHEVAESTIVIVVLTKKM